MRFAIVLAGVLAGMSLGFVAAGDDLSILSAQRAAVQKKPALGLEVRSAKSPLPTQVWWTDRKGNFIVYESGPGRLTEFDSWKRQTDPTTVFVGDHLIRDWTVPAPNGDWSVRIDHRRPLVSFI